MKNNHCLIHKKGAFVLLSGGCCLSCIHFLRGVIKRTSLVSLAVGLLFVNFAEAQGLYQAQVEQAEISGEKLRKTVEALEKNPRVKVKDVSFVPPFHYRVEQTKDLPQGLCVSCHGKLPHKKNLRSRTFQNMHSRYIACETCHFRPKGYTLTYGWFPEIAGADGQLKRHKIVDVDADFISSSTSLSSGDVQDSRLAKASLQVEDSPTRPAGRRIVPFNEEVPLIHFGEYADSASARRFAARVAGEWESDSIGVRAKIKAKLHTPLQEKGPACIECHTSENAFIDFSVLGISPEKRRLLEENIIARFFDRAKADHQTIRINQLLR